MKDMLKNVSLLMDLERLRKGVKVDHEEVKNEKVRNEAKNVVQKEVKKEGKPQKTLVTFKF